MPESIVYRDFQCPSGRCPYAPLVQTREDAACHAEWHREQARPIAERYTKGWSTDA